MVAVLRRRSRSPGRGRRDRSRSRQRQEPLPEAAGWRGQRQRRPRTPRAAPRRRRVGAKALRRRHQARDDRWLRSVSASSGPGSLPRASAQRTAVRSSRAAPDRRTSARGTQRSAGGRSTPRFPIRPARAPRRRRDSRTAEQRPSARRRGGQRGDSTRARASRSARRSRVSRRRGGASRGPRTDHGGRLRGMAGEARDEQRRAGREQRTQGCEQLGDRPLLLDRSGRSRAPTLPRPRTSANVSSRSRKPRPNAESRTSGKTLPRSKLERSANSAVAMTTYTGVASKPSDDRHAEGNRDRTRDASRQTRRTTGRAIAMRRTNSPIAAITDRNDDRREP